METRNYNEIMSEMSESARNVSGLADFNEGSVIMTIFESIARPMEQGYIDTRNGYNNNLRAIPYSVFDFKQKEGQKATVTVKFTRNAATADVSTIPSGTRVSNGSLIFTTTASATIASGQTVSTAVGAIAEEVGLQYNVAANTVTVIESNLSAEIVGVNNDSPAIGGTDAETQTQMLRRFKTFINGLQGSNRYGIEAGVLGIEGVRSVSLEEHFPPKHDIYNFTIYVDDGTGGLDNSIKNQVLDLINGTDTEEQPGLRAAGINFEVSPANPVTVNIKLTATIYRVEQARILTDVTKKLQEYINGLGIHENVVLSSIIVLLKQIPGITDISGLMFKIDDSEEWVADNVNIAVNAIARCGTVTTTIVNQ